MGRVKLIRGDALGVLKQMPDCCIDAIVSDPPAGIEFMGKKWDRPDANVRSWEQGMSKHGFTDGADRVAAPKLGGSSKNPTCRRCGKRQRTWKTGPPACTCTQPDFPNPTVRLRTDFIAGMASIFVQCLRVLKPGAFALVWGIPKRSHWTACALEDAGFELHDRLSHFFGTGRPMTHKHILKPAVEDWILARKPPGRTLKGTVEKWGTGLLNIDGCRVGTTGARNNGRKKDSDIYGDYGSSERVDYNMGRWPPHLLLSHGAGCRADACEPGCPVALLDAQSGTLQSGKDTVKRASGADQEGNTGESHGAECRPSGTPMVFYGDKGGASRFFPTFRYQAKAKSDEKFVWCYDCEEVWCWGDKAAKKRHKGHKRERHPTLKSIDLMCWLVRLAGHNELEGHTPVLLDPFMGTGSTGVACCREGKDFIGVERESVVTGGHPYFEIAEYRLAVENR